MAQRSPGWKDKSLHQHRRLKGGVALRRPRYMEISVTDTSAEIQINHRFYNASYPVEFEIQLCEAHVWVCNRTIIARTGRVTATPTIDDLLPGVEYVVFVTPLHAMSPGAPDISGKVTTLECRFDCKDVPPVKNMSVTPGDTYAVVQFLHDRYAPPVRYEINYCLQKKSDCQTKRIAPFSTDVYVNVTELVPDTEYSVFVKTLIITGTGYVDGPRTPTVLFSTKPCHVNCPEPREVVVMPINHEAVKVDIYTHSASRKNPVYLNVSWCDVGMQSCAFKNENVTTRNASLQIQSLSPGQRYTLTVYQPKFTRYIPYYKVEFATPACGDKCGLESHLGLTSEAHNDSATVTVIFPIFPCNGRETYNVTYSALTHYGLVEGGPIVRAARVFKIHGLELWTSYSFRAYYRCRQNRGRPLQGSIDTGPGPLHPVENITAETQENNIEITIVDIRNPEKTTYTVRTDYIADEETSTVPREGPRTVISRRTDDLISRGGNCAVYVTPWINVGGVTYKGTTQRLMMRLMCTRLYPDRLCNLFQKM